MKRIVLTTLLPLIIGVAIYLLFRTTALMIFDWLDFVGLKNFICKIRQEEVIKNIKPNDFIKYSLADGLWVFSYTSGILLIWNNEINLKNIFWLTILPFIGLTIEVGQLLGFTTGTFDVSDLLCYVIGFFLPIFLFHKPIKKIQYENN